MSSPMANLEKFLIPLKEIMLAAENFQDENTVIEGTDYSIFRGQLSESWENRTAVFKRFYKGKKEFLYNELKVISILNHESIIPFLGYCDEGEEMIIVYDYAAVNGSLIEHLEFPDKRSCLTWQHRLRICLDAVRGLGYLHSGLGQHGTVIYGSMMNGNMLLDDNLKAKICGFENSELIPSNQPHKQVYKPANYTGRGRRYYTDPIYLETGFLNAESDIYSIGVLLFGILTGPAALHVKKEPEDYMLDSLSMMVQHHYHNRLDSIIDPAIRDQLGGPSFRMIEEITCKCLSYNIKDRPTMDTLVKTIKDALDIHVSLFFI